MEKDLISVVVPAYNHANYVESTIRSIINQTYQNLELIILNDGSPDNTAEVIEFLRAECETRFSKFIFIDKKNEGLVKTLNRGLKECSGEYILCIASDDVYEPEAIYTMHNFLKQNSEYGIAVCDNSIMDNDGKLCFWDKDRNNVYSDKEAEYKSFGDFLQKTRKDVDFHSNEFGSYKSLLAGNYIPNGYMIRKELYVDKVGGYTEKLKLDDHYLMLQLAKYTKFKFIDKPLFRYRWHDSNSIKTSSIYHAERGKLIELEKDYAIKHGFEKELYRIKTSGIPFILEVDRRLTLKGKQRRIKLFGITIYKRIKAW